MTEKKVKIDEKEDQRNDEEEKESVQEKNDSKAERFHKGANSSLSTIQENGEIGATSADKTVSEKSTDFAQTASISPQIQKTVKKSLLRKGILRNANSEPVILAHHPTPASANTFSYPRGKYVVSNRMKSTQEFINPAFELDEAVPTHYKISDIVQQALQRSHSDEYIHPYGRGNLYSTVFLGEKIKVHASGGHLAFWIIFLLCMVGIAGAVILMAEMYKLHDHSSNVTISDYDA